MYDSFTSDYDRFNNWPARLAFELPFIENLLKALQPAGKPLKVLDAACGTGQHALALARKGYTVSGADLSSPMIAAARENARLAGLNLDLRAVGFGSLAQAFGPSSFDAVLCLGNSLPHLLTAADLDRALQDFAACLHPGGMLLIQNRNFDAVMRSRQRWMEPQPFRDESGEWLFQRFYDFEANSLIRFNIVTLKRLPGGDWSSSVGSTFLRPQISTDLAAAVARIGFTSSSLFGSLNGDPFDPAGSGNLVLWAIK